MAALNFIKNYFIWASVTFFIFIIIGVVVEIFVFDDFSSTTESMIHENTKWTTIFFNNWVVSLILASGVFIYGISTFILLIINGYLFGTALATSYSGGASVIDILKAVVPHGLVEIPAILLATAIGFYGVKFYDQDNKKSIFKKFGFILIFASLLLLIGSFIEANISTPL